MLTRPWWERGGEGVAYQLKLSLQGLRAHQAMGPGCQTALSYLWSTPWPRRGGARLTEPLSTLCSCRRSYTCPLHSRAFPRNVCVHLHTQSPSIHSGAHSGPDLPGCMGDQDKDPLHSGPGLPNFDLLSLFSLLSLPLTTSASLRWPQTSQSPLAQRKAGITAQDHLPVGTGYSADPGLSHSHHHSRSGSPDTATQAPQPSLPLRSYFALHSPCQPEGSASPS